MSEHDALHIRPASAPGRALIHALWSVRPTRPAAQRTYPDGRHGLSIDLTTGAAWLEPAAAEPGAISLTPGAPRVGARLALGAARALFDVDPDWGPEPIALVDVAPTFAAVIDAVLDAAGADPRAALAALDRGLSAHAARAPRPSPTVAAAAHRLTHAAPRVDEVAAALGCTVRQLQRRFRDEVGLSPKQIAQIHRARVAREHIAAHPDRGLADVAAELGFADQAQMTRLFARYSGTTPGRYRRRKQREAR